MNRFIIFTFTMLLLLSCSMDKNKSVEHYIKAKNFYKNNDIKNASSEIELAISLDSTNLDFQIIKAKILVETDNYEQAIKTLTKLTIRSFKLDTVNYFIGNCYYRYGNYLSMVEGDEDKKNDSYEKGLNFYKVAINSNIQYFNAYVGKGKVLHNLDRYDEALIVINTAIKLFPDSVLLISHRGIEKLYLGDLTGAMKDLNSSIQSNKLDSVDLALAYRFRGNINVEKGNFDQAIIDYTDALILKPKDFRTLFTRAECYKEKGMKDKACEDYRKAADLGYLSMYKIIKEYCGE